MTNQVNTTWKTIDHHNWNLLSKTGTYSFKTFVQFSNLYGKEYSAGMTTVHWTQGCQVQIDQVAFKEFTAANRETSEIATTTMMINGTKSGDCGSTFDIDATLTAQNGTTQSIDFDTASFFSASGSSVTTCIGFEQ